MNQARGSAILDADLSVARGCAGAIVGEDVSPRGHPWYRPGTGHTGHFS